MGCVSIWDVTYILFKLLAVTCLHRTLNSYFLTSGWFAVGSKMYATIIGSYSFDTLMMEIPVREKKRVQRMFARDPILTKLLAPHLNESHKN